MNFRTLSLRGWLLLLALVLPGRSWGASPPPLATDVSGSLADALLKRPVGSVRVYAFRGKSASAIPFQVDERDRKDRFVTDHGPSPARDDSPGVFDANDVDVFMNRDLGGRRTKAALPAGAHAWVEVRVGAEASPLGWAYVGTFDDPPPVGPKVADYGRYEPKADEIFAERYAIRFGAPLPTFLSFVKGQGRTGDNVLNGVRALGEARILANLFRIVRTDKDLEAEVQGWRDGPVRVIRSSKYWIRLPLGFKARGKVDVLLYRDFVEGRAKVNIRIPPRLVPADGVLTVNFDFRGLEGSRVQAIGGVLEGQTVDGRMTDLEREFGKRSTRWSALHLPQGGQAFLLATRLGGSLQRLEQKVYFDDSAETTARPAFGFRFSGINRLDTGDQDLAVAAVLLDGATPADVSQAANLYLNTPEIAVTEPR